MLSNKLKYIHLLFPFLDLLELCREVRICVKGFQIYPMSSCKAISTMDLFLSRKELYSWCLSGVASSCSIQACLVVRWRRIQTWPQRRGKYPLGSAIAEGVP